MTWRKFMIFVAMGFLWTGSQIPLYLFGGIIPLIEETIGGADRYVWIALGNLIPLATVTPFVGGMSDLFGRRNIAMFAALCGIVGSIVCATAHTMNVFIGGQTIIGVGAGIGELTALAVASESAPTKKRGLYIGGIVSVSH
jgi:MFS family permease